MSRLSKAVFAIAVTPFSAGTTYADSSSPKLAAYYDLQMAIFDGRTFAWQGDGPVVDLKIRAIRVGVGRRHFYALTADGRLRSYSRNLRKSEIILSGIAAFSAGDSGILAMRPDRSLVLLRRGGRKPVPVARDVINAAVGDSANYFVTRAGRLFVRGKAHRGQYGDGRLTVTKAFVNTARNVASVRAHTGHALYLSRDGHVYGTGGNIYGPVGIHGLGDKADRWSLIYSGAWAIATGSTHSFAIRSDGALVGWGRAYGPKPKVLMRGVTAVAAGSSKVVVLKSNRSLWQWHAGDQPKLVILPNRR